MLRHAENTIKVGDSVFVVAIMQFSEAVFSFLSDVKAEFC